MLLVLNSPFDRIFVKTLIQYVYVFIKHEKYAAYSIVS